MTTEEPERRGAANCTEAQRSLWGCGDFRHPRHRRCLERGPNEATCLAKASRLLNVKLAGGYAALRRSHLKLQIPAEFPVFPQVHLPSEAFLHGRTRNKPQPSALGRGILSSAEGSISIAS